MFDNFKYFLGSEVIRRLEPFSVPTPWHRLTVLRVRFELKQRVINAVKQNFIMDVLTLSNECGCHLLLVTVSFLLFS